MPTLFVRFAVPLGGATLAVACLSCRTNPESTPWPVSSSGPVASASPAAPSAPPAAPSAMASADAAATASFPVPRASVDLVLNPGGLPPYQGPTGSVEGTVRIEGPPAPDVHVDAPKCPAALDTYGKLFRSGSSETPGGPRTLADAVVVVTGYSGFYVPEKNDAVHVTIGSQCTYPSRTIAITYGQRLDITNQSSLLFAPLLDPTMTTALMVAPPHENGEAVKIYPTKAGYFTLTDRLQLFVREDLYVFRHPLHAVTDTAGHYRIDGLPVGPVKVGVHHPTADADAEAALDVVAGAVKTVDLTLTYKPKPKAKVVDAGVLPPRLRLD